jgi:hypothetical protein
MDKTFLLRVNKAFKKIRTMILLNEKIRTLLYYDVVDDNTVAPAITQAKDHVFLQPIVKVDTQEPFNKKNYITITVPEGDKDNNKMGYVVRVIVMCDQTTWNLNEDIRPLMIAQEVINELDGQHVGFSNTLEFTNIVETVTTKDVTGYSILFAVVDGISDVDEK